MINIVNCSLIGQNSGRLLALSSSTYVAGFEVGYRSLCNAFPDVFKQLYRLIAKRKVHIDRRYIPHFSVTSVNKFLVGGKFEWFPKKGHE